VLETPEKIRELRRKLCQKAKGIESHWKKMIGKPCAGKLHARFDEGELEIGLLLLRQFSTLPSLTFARGLCDRNSVSGTLRIGRMILYSQVRCAPASTQVLRTETVADLHEKVATM
jgi:hypothetical protein